MANDVGRPVGWDDVAARLGLMAMDANATGTLKSVERAEVIVKRRMASFRKSDFSPSEVMQALGEWEAKSKWFPAYSDLASIMRRNREYEAALERHERNLRKQLRLRKEAEEFERKYKTPEARARVRKIYESWKRRMAERDLEVDEREKITAKYDPDQHAPPSRELKEMAASLGLDVHMEDD